MLFGRALSRDVTQFQLQQLHKVFNLSTNASRKTQRFPLPQFACASRSNTFSRSYAAKATKATKPTRTVKTAVKRTARKPAKTVRSTTAKKPVAKKAAPKRTAKATRKKAVKKKAVPKRKKKALSERQKALVAKKKSSDRVKKLVELALTKPKEKPATAWTVFVSEAVKATEFKGSNAGKGGVNAVMKDAALKYKSMSPAEREHYNHLASEAKSANDAAYAAWVTKFAPLDIRRANSARTLLSRLRRTTPELSRQIPKSLPQIQDGRQVKRPSGPFQLFVTERHQSGDLKHIALVEAMRLCTEEWKALTSSEKKKYDDLATQDRSRYESEHLKIYGVPIGSRETAVTSLL